MRRPITDDPPPPPTDGNDLSFENEPDLDEAAFANFGCRSCRPIRSGSANPLDIEKMMRVRLRGDLQNESIEELSLLAMGSSGADVERIIKDARRFARHEERPLSLADLRRAVLGRDDSLSSGMLERAAVHEQLGDSDYLLRALWGLCIDQFNNGEFRKALEFANRFAEVVAGSDNSIDLMMADRLRATTLHYLGDQNLANHHNYQWRGPLPRKSYLFNRWSIAGRLVVTPEQDRTTPAPAVEGEKISSASASEPAPRTARFRRSAAPCR
jgi:hypothetical protein